MDVRRFTRADVPAAAALLAARAQEHPLAAPFDAAAEIGQLLDDGHTGWVAEGGYLIGKADADAAWSLYTGHAARDAATYRRLYRAIGREWVEAEHRRHAIVAPEGDPVGAEAFGNLAFGREHVCALARLADQPAEPPPAHVAIRDVGPDEVDAIAPLLPTLARHLSDPPVWSPRPAAYYEGLTEDFREDVAEPHTTYRVASLDGVDVGFASWEPMPSRVCVPEGTYALSHMAVLPEARGRGVGRALTLDGLALLRERGVTVTWTDWRLTNMSAEPYWRTYGWRPYNVRWTRRIEPDPD
ncbi:MAG TPA: GNAT family N-acetyltransferase [Frankiaceae bacterium]|nr:GNAT family N-acetyltransferase [Frankiaceae bacterium]